jgi:antitoxin MazE
MHSVIKKWGNSPSIRIPLNIMRAAHFKLDQVVEVREESGRVVIEPIKEPEYSLKQLLKRITSDNLHSEADFGEPAGNESW